MKSNELSSRSQGVCTEKRVDFKQTNIKHTIKKTRHIVVLARDPENAC